ncbi:MAG: hypothetical protein Q4C82_06665 [Eubacteriales bacterium]|nr:hypothetical protein [Eubacteriales bacterium]
MLTFGKIRIACLLAALLLTGGIAAVIPAHRGTLLLAEASAEDRGESAGRKSARTDSMNREYDRQRDEEQELTAALEETEEAGGDEEEILELQTQIHNAQLRQKVLKARLEAGE